MRGLLILFVTFCFVNLCFAQTRYFDLYMYNTKIINPALMALTNEQNFDAQYTVDNLDNPKAFTRALVSYSTRLQKINSGIGFVFYNNDFQYYYNSNVSILYNYQWNVSEISTISFGTELRYQKIAGFTAANKIYDRFDFDLGALYQRKEFYVSLGVRNLLKSIDDRSLIGVYSNRLYTAYILRNFKINQWLNVSPSFYFISDLKEPWTLDGNINIEIKNLITLGITQRIEEDEISSIYSAGIKIMNKADIIARWYSGLPRKYDEKGIELLLKIKISND